MLKQYKTKDQKGFTIIEVLIVLAIAGLILLIVFLAVPALQRNSRNTQRKEDIGRIGTAATTVVSNNNGKTSVLAGTTGTTLVKNEVGDNLSYYQSANITSTDLTSGGTQANPNDVDKVTVVGDAKCTQPIDGTATYANRQVAVLYTTEGGSANAKDCVDE